MPLGDLMLLRLLDRCFDCMRHELPSRAPRYAPMEAPSSQIYVPLFGRPYLAPVLRIDSIKLTVQALLHRIVAGGNLAAVVKERQQVQMEVWTEATAESVRATLARAVPDVAYRTIVTLNNQAAA